MKNLLRLKVEDSSQTGEARRLTMPLCRALGFSEHDSGKVSLIVTELATNLAKHSSGGELIVRSLTFDDVNGVEILSLDRGLGMVNTQRSLQDGFSSSGSPGTGLGAVRRLSSAFDLYSQPG